MIEDTIQLENTRRKLKLLQDRLAALENEPVINAYTRQLTKRSLKDLADQLSGEIADFQSRQAESAAGS